MTPVLGFLDNAQEALSELVTGVLMVAGGFLVGYLVGGVVAWAAGRYIFKQKDNEILKRLGRPIGGVLLALIVAILVFTGKGKPHGEGGDGQGAPQTAGKTDPKTDPRVDPQLPPIKLPENKHAATTILVTVYGGSKVPVGTVRFYRLDDENDLRTLASLQEAITARRGAEKGKVTVQIRMPEDRNDRPADPRIITQLTEWANAQGLDVTFPATK